MNGTSSANSGNSCNKCSGYYVTPTIKTDSRPFDLETELLASTTKRKRTLRCKLTEKGLKSVFFVWTFVLSTGLKEIVPSTPEIILVEAFGRRTRCPSGGSQGSCSFSAFMDKSQLCHSV